MVGDVHFSSPYDKVYKFNYVGDVIVFIPGKIVALPRRMLMRQEMSQMVYL